jgi:sporulation protein YlmC with PRC-barrel domain
LEGNTGQGARGEHERCPHRKARAQAQKLRARVIEMVLVRQARMLFLLSALCTASAPPAVAAPADDGMRLSEIIGREVRSHDGRPLGPILDVLVDRRTGKVEHVLLEGGRPYPVDALKAGQDGEVLLEAPTGDAATGASAAPSALDLLRASELLTRIPRDSSGKALGIIRDLVVDPLGRELRAAVLESGVTLPIGAELLRADPLAR